jgi:UDP-glucose 4-epimerase
MDIRGKRLVVVGGAGLIGSHTVDRLLREDVGEIVVYDNFVRGRAENLTAAVPTASFTSRRSGSCNATSFRAARSRPTCAARST